MTRRDAALLAASAAAFAGLLAASWRATPDRHDTTVALYIAAGILEFIGVSTVALDLRARRQRLRRFRSSVGTVFGPRNRRQMTLTPPMPSHGDPTTRIANLERNIRTQIDQLDRESASRDALFIQLIGTNDSDTAAWIGFATLLLGVLVGVAGNLISASA